MRTWSIVVGLAALTQPVLASSAQSCATGVGCQLPDQLPHGPTNATAVLSDLGTGAAAAENFTAAASGDITAICWWGRYLDLSSFSDCGDSSADTFSITYYADAGASPGAVLAGPILLVPSAKFATGNLTQVGPKSFEEWQYEATHAAVPVVAGQCYWIEIQQQSGGRSGVNCQWQWATAPAGDSLAASRGAGPFTPLAFDLAFCVDVAITADGCACPAPVPYCTAGTSAAGCATGLTATGLASASAASGFDLLASPAEPGKDGLFFFAANGRQANPWGNGSSFQCVVPPVQRGGLISSTGAGGACAAAFGQDLNALWCPTCPKPQKNPGAGAIVQAQLWYRDPQSTSNQTTSLSDAIEFCVRP